MRKIPEQRFAFPVLLVGFGLAWMFNCTGEKSVIGFSSYSQSYYPLGVGFTWYYDRVGAIENPCITYTVEKKFIENNRTYFVMMQYSESLDGFPVWRDTVYQDDRGRIWKRVNGQDYLWFDFTLGEGDTYPFQTDTICNYTVEVKRDLKIQTPAGSFENCIEFFLYDTEWVDSEQWLYFAPGVGLIKEMVGEGPTMVLHSYHD